jgi:hypothetical protein
VNDLLPSTDSEPEQKPNRAAWRIGRHWWRGWLPPLVSAGLVGWLIWRVSLHALLEAAARQNLALLIPATLTLVATLYLWDAVCLRWLFVQPNGSPTYLTTLRARGTSYLASAFNYELGQGLLAWLMARSLGIGLLPALGRCLVLALHDVAVLLTLGLIGSLGDSDARVGALPLWCLAGLAVLLIGLVAAGLVQQRWRARLGAGLGGWHWTRSVRLYGLRIVYFGIIVAYAAVGLSLCGVPLSRGVLLGVIPLVLLADGLPISVSGLGTREATLLYLLQPEHPEVILAWGLLWSAGLLAGRTGIGLISVWLGHHPPKGEEDTQ